MLYTRDALGVNGDGCNERSYTWFLVRGDTKRTEHTNSRSFPRFVEKEYMQYEWAAREIAYLVENNDEDQVR